MPIRQKCQIFAQPPSVIIKFTSVNQKNLGNNDTTTMPKNENKSQKAKISNTLSIKKGIAEAKWLNINDFTDNLAGVIGSIFLKRIKHQADYKDCFLAYYYCLFLIFSDFN